MSQRLNRAIAALVLIGSAVCAERPAMPPEVADHATAYMEWVLDAPFSDGQRAHYREILDRMWRGGGKGSDDAITGMARAHQSLAQVANDERDRMRVSQQKALLRLLESANDEPSRWLLAVYRDAHGAGAAPVASTIVGHWRDGHVSSIQYKNAYTGAPAPTNGQTYAYVFNPDGTYSFTGLMQSVMYNCTTAMFSNETGTYTVDGDSVSLNPEKNPYRMTNNCAPSSNREAPGKLIARTYRFQVVAESGRKYLQLRGNDGGVQKFAEDR